MAKVCHLKVTKVEIEDCPQMTRLVTLLSLEDEKSIEITVPRYYDLEVGHILHAIDYGVLGYDIVESVHTLPGDGR